MNYDFDPAQLFTFGAVGEPGQRTFVMQLKNDANGLVSLKMEKQQVSALCESLLSLLADLPPTDPVTDDLELQEPVEIAWSAGAIAVSYDEIRATFSIIVEESDFDAGPDDPVSRAHIEVTPAQGASASLIGNALVESGRPPCQLCGHPLDPRGHSCPKTNGHRPPSP